MSLRDEVALYTELSGNDGNHTPIGIIGAYLDGYEKGKASVPEPHWIPCSEGLPEDGRQVLVYARSVHYALAKYDEMREADGTYKKQWVTFDAWKPFYTIKEVIAWMPLPEPYQKGEQNESEN